MHLFQLYFYDKPISQIIGTFLHSALQASVTLSNLYFKFFVNYKICILFLSLLIYLQIVKKLDRQFAMTNTNISLQDQVYVVPTLVYCHFEGRTRINQENVVFPFRL